MQVLLLIAAVLMAITLHEFAHAWMSDRLGDETARVQGRLTLNPAAHIDPVMTLALPLLLIVLNSPIIFGAARPVPFKPWALRFGKWGAALVAAAGPATNFLLAAFFGAWLRFVNLSTSAEDILLSLVGVNVAFAIFNLIPFPPLDGSRILYAVAPGGLRSVMDRIEQTGLTAVVLFLFVAYPLISPVIADLVVGTVGLLAGQTPSF